LTNDNNFCTFEEKTMKINFNPFGHWLHDLWKQREKEQTFLDYAGLKYFFNQEMKFRFYYACKQVYRKGVFNLEDLRQIQELGIPLGQIDGFNLTGFQERTSPASYDTFVGYLINICDNKFTKEQIKQTIENE